jgi:hypothetical protein
MIFFSFQTHDIPLGIQDTHHCKMCECTQQHETILQYELFTFMIALYAVTGRKYLSVCNKCQIGQEVPKEQIMQFLNSDPISWWKRNSFKYIFPLLVLWGAIEFFYDSYAGYFK